MTEPGAKIIADSISPAGHRLTTMEIVMHRFVLAEFNTHRMFSRNSASSRAIPISTTLKQYDEDPALPISWPAENPGMSGGAQLVGLDLEEAKDLLRKINYSTSLYVHDYVAANPEPEHRLHKSVLNRYLEPFRWHTVVCTSTEWSNFFKQRVSPLAQPEMRVVAEAMKEAYLLSQPRIVANGNWHTPYVDDAELKEWWSASYREDTHDFEVGLHPAGREVPDWNAVSAARCARVSRERQGSEGQNIEADLKTYDRLCNPGDGPPHASPLEHVATPCPPKHWDHFPRAMAHPNYHHKGNFTGWDQLRHQILDF